MQPLARLSHSVAVLEPEETVRGSSRSVVLPNSEGVVSEYDVCIFICCNHEI